MAISVEKLSETQFKVTVTGRQTTTHSVTVTSEYAQRLTGGQVSVQVLIEKSFEFLLERESNSSILRSFELPVIQSYFPDYESTIVKQI